MEHSLAVARGSLKSSTVWVASILLALPELLPLIQANFATIAPFIPVELHSRVLQVMALGMLILRLKTTTSLADKGRKPPTVE